MLISKVRFPKMAVKIVSSKQSLSSRVIEDFYVPFFFVFSCSSVYFLYLYMATLPSFFIGVFIGSLFGVAGTFFFLGRFVVEYISDMTLSTTTSIMKHSDEFLKLLQERGITGQTINVLKVLLPLLFGRRLEFPPVPLGEKDIERLSKPEPESPKPPTIPPKPERMPERIPEQKLGETPYDLHSEISNAIVGGLSGSAIFLMESPWFNPNKIDLVGLDFSMESNSIIYLIQRGYIKREDLLQRYVDAGNFYMVKSLIEKCKVNHKNINITIASEKQHHDVLEYLYRVDNGLRAQ